MEENKEKSYDFTDYYRGIEMTNVDEALKNLISALKEQECCLKYQDTLKDLKADKELFVRFNEFRKKNMELHMSENSLLEQSALRKEYEELLKKEKVSNFLYWEQQVTELFRGIYDEITENAELDYSFLD